MAEGGEDVKRELGSTLLGKYLFVRSCAGCGELLSHDQWENAFCDACLLRYRAAKLESCPHCLLSAHQCRCMPSGLSQTGMISLRKMILYHSKKRGEPQNQLIYRLKQSANRRMANFVARELSEGILEELRILGVEPSEARVVGIPRGRKAKNLYGHDQAPFLAQAISQVSEIPYVAAIGRKRGGKEQKHLKRGGRFRNIRHLFYPTAKAAELRGRCVLLVDDVVTTGASMAACVKLLRETGAKEILGLCVGQNEN